MLFSIVFSFLVALVTSAQSADTQNPTDFERLCEENGEFCHKVVLNLLESQAKKVNSRPRLIPRSNMKQKQALLQDKPALLGDSEQCIRCTSLISFLFNEGCSKYTTQMFKKVVDTVCPNVPTLKSFCDTVDSAKIERLVSLMSAKFTPREICVSGNMC